MPTLVPLCAARKAENAVFRLRGNADGLGRSFSALVLLFALDSNGRPCAATKMNGEAAQPSSRGKHLSLSERFERSRLAVLSYSAASILCSAATGAHGRDPSAYGISLDAMNLAALAWLVASFYLWAFWRYDFPALRSVHTRFADSADRTGFDTIARGLAERVKYFESALIAEIRQVAMAMAKSTFDETRASVLIDGDFRSSIREKIPELLGLPLSAKNYHINEEALDALSKLVAKAAEEYQRSRVKLELFLLNPDSERETEIRFPVPVVDNGVLSQIVAALSDIRANFELVSESLDRKESERLIYWEGLAPKLVWLAATIILIVSFASVVCDFTIPGPRLWALTLRGMINL